MRYNALPRALLKAVIHIYRMAISPLTGPNCRFHPTCSAYALEAVDRYGALKGGILSMRRLLKCHPWHKGDMLDPVPAAIDWPAIIGYKRVQSKTHVTCGMAAPCRKDDNNE